MKGEKAAIEHMQHALIAYLMKEVQTEINGM
jgi:hypothetical protein